MTIVEMLVAALEEALDQTEDGRAHDGQRCYQSFCWVDAAYTALAAAAASSKTEAQP